MNDPYPTEKARPLDREAELRQVLGRLPPSEHPSAARYFRLGWNRLAQLQEPILRRWEASWWRQAREIEGLRAQIGQLIARIAQLQERG
jgi:hypothetical protein